MSTIKQRIEASEKLHPYLRSGSTGSENYYRMVIGGILYTEGVKEVLEKNEALWVLGIIGSYRREIGRSEGFCVARICKEGEGCLFALDEGNDDGEYLVTQEIEYTDIRANLKLYVQTDGERWFLMMPEEY